MPGTPKTWGYVLCNSLQQATTRLASYTRTGPLFLVVPSRELSNFHPKSPFLIPLWPKFVPQTSLLVYIHQKAIKKNNKNGIITSIFTKIIIMFIFHQNPQFSPFSFKLHKEPHQFKPHQHANMYKLLWSEFKHVSTTITHQFMIYTQLIKKHQNNLSTPTTMKCKHITLKFHQVYHTHKFTWIMSTKFFIKNHEKSQLT